MLIHTHVYVHTHTHTLRLQTLPLFFKVTTFKSFQRRGLLLLKERISSQGSYWYLFFHKNTACSPTPSNRKGGKHFHVRIIFLKLLVKCNIFIFLSSYEPAHDKTYYKTYMISKNWDQPVHLRSLISLC